MTKKKKLAEWIDEVLGSDTKPCNISFGQLFIVWLIVPLFIGINYIVLFGAITKSMACSLFVPSTIASMVWYFSKTKRWYKRLFTF